MGEILTDYLRWFLCAAGVFVSIRVGAMAPPVVLGPAGAKIVHSYTEEPEAAFSPAPGRTLPDRAAPLPARVYTGYGPAEFRLRIDGVEGDTSDPLFLHYAASPVELAGRGARETASLAIYELRAGGVLIDRGLMNPNLPGQSGTWVLLSGKPVLPSPGVAVELRVFLPSFEGAGEFGYGTLYAGGFYLSPRPEGTLSPPAMMDLARGLPDMARALEERLAESTDRATGENDLDALALADLIAYRLMEEEGVLGLDVLERHPIMGQAYRSATGERTLPLPFSIDRGVARVSETDELTFGVHPSLLLGFMRTGVAEAASDSGEAAHPAIARVIPASPAGEISGACCDPAFPESEREMRRGLRAAVLAMDESTLRELGQQAAGNPNGALARAMGEESLWLWAAFPNRLPVLESFREGAESAAVETPLGRMLAVMEPGFISPLEASQRVARVRSEVIEAGDGRSGGECADAGSRLRIWRATADLARTIEEARTLGAGDLVATAQPAVSTLWTDFASPAGASIPAPLPLLLMVRAALQTDLAERFSRDSLSTEQGGYVASRRLAAFRSLFLHLIESEREAGCAGQHLGQTWERLASLALLEALRDLQAALAGENPEAFHRYAAYLEKELPVFVEHRELEEASAWLDQEVSPRLASLPAERVAAYHAHRARLLQNIKGSNDAVRENLERVAEIQPGTQLAFESLTRLSELYKESWDLPEEAIEVQREIAEQFAGESRGWSAAFNVAKFNYEEKKYERALYELTVLGETLPEAYDRQPIHLLSGMSYLALSDMESARNQFARVVNAGDDTRREQALYLMAYTHIVEQDYDRAVQPLNDLLMLYPNGQYERQARQWLSRFEASAGAAAVQ
ncbi:MAG: hypothetical protein RLY93_02800 [Sumerlaeia bacterium]